MRAWCPRSRAGFHAGFASLDGINFEETCHARILTLQSLLLNCKFSVPEVPSAPASPDASSLDSRAVGSSSAWPRACSCTGAAGDGRVPPGELDRRCQLGSGCRCWPRQLGLSPGNDEEARAHRAAALVHRRIPQGVFGRWTTHSGSCRTLSGALPKPMPRCPLQSVPFRLLSRAPSLFSCSSLAFVGGTRGRSAAEPSRIRLDDEDDSRLLHSAAQQLTLPFHRPFSPDLAGQRLGRLVALRKPNGRVCAVVAGDVLRRLVGCSLGP